MTYTLVFLRHGKSIYPEGVADHDRPLAPRGERQAKVAGEWISEKVGPFDLVLCSTATRTRMTLEEAGLEGPVKYLDDLYIDSHVEYVEVVREHAGDAKKIAVVGHEPAISATALGLTRDRTTKAARRMATKYPTSAVAVLTGKHALSSLMTGRMDLEHFHVPEREH